MAASAVGGYPLDKTIKLEVDVMRCGARLTSRGAARARCRRITDAAHQQRGHGVSGMRKRGKQQRLRQAQETEQRCSKYSFTKRSIWQKRIKVEYVDVEDEDKMRVDGWGEVEGEW